MLTFQQRDWLMDNVGSPAAPLVWFSRIKSPAAPLGWLLAVAKWLVLMVWAVAFLWVWFPVFAVLFFWEGFGSSRPPCAPSS